MGAATAPEGCNESEPPPEWAECKDWNLDTHTKIKAS